jgi:hypothetical protein
VCAASFAVKRLTLSRLKPVPQVACGVSVGTAKATFHKMNAAFQWDGQRQSHKVSAAFQWDRQRQSHKVSAAFQWDRLQPGRGRCVRRKFCDETPDAFPAKAGPTSCLRCVSWDGKGHIPQYERGISVGRATPIPPGEHGFSVGPALAGKGPVYALRVLQ